MATWSVSLTADDIRDIHRRATKGESFQSLADSYKVSREVIRHLRRYPTIDRWDAEYERGPWTWLVK